jgi:histidine triad (HIT) family protein
VHIVVIPKKHVSSFVTLSADDMPIFLKMVEAMKTLAAKVSAEHGAARVLTNLGRYQDSKHLHFHVSSGQPLR